MMDQGADQNWTVVEGYIDWNECKILLDTGVDKSVVKEDLVPAAAYTNDTTTIRGLGEPQTCKVARVKSLHQW